MQDYTNAFLSCDWGTSAFRLRLGAADGLQVLANWSSKRGIASVHEEWKAAAQDESDRLNFYRATLNEGVQALERALKQSLQGLPILISGMASSNIGMKELPYKPLPFAIDGSDLQALLLPANPAFPYPVLLISGVCSSEDVMRGEETQIVGCDLSNEKTEQLVIHPGTHSKHVWVKDGEVTAFRTFMSGEMFSLLSTKSILADSVCKGATGLEDAAMRAAFEAGLRDAEALPLLHAAFSVRTAMLFKKRSAEENFFCLSGLIIGTELNNIPAHFKGTLTLAGAPALTRQYHAALEARGVLSRVRSFAIKDAEAITLAGQYAVWKQHCHRVKNP